VLKVADGIGTDKRIGRSFLNAGLGYGGSCFPKDIAAFIAIAEQLGTPFGLLKEVGEHQQAPARALPGRHPRGALGAEGQEAGGLGLAFKPDADDVRSSVAINLVETMVAEGANIVAYDPKAMDKAKQLPSLTRSSSRKARWRPPRTQRP